MSHWWEIATEDPSLAIPRPRAVAYYRHSAQDRQENSIPIQREQVREWAEKNNLEIIQEFEDAGKSGLNAEGRPAFNEMMDEWVKQRKDFDYVLCLDVSRWGRFQDIDLSAQYSAECKRNGKLVVYTTIGMPRKDDALHPVYIQFERFRAAQYSKELSEKVWRGCVKIAEQGYWAGGAPPYGLQRLLLDERREPLHVLEPGQRKSIQNQRVTLVMGDPGEVAVIQRIFHEFVEQRHSEYLIAERLNTDDIRSPGGYHWTAGMVVSRLRNEKYLGTMVYNRTTQKLKTPRQMNPEEQWVRTPEAFEGVISAEQFTLAQEIFAQRRRKYQTPEMLAQLTKLHRQYGIIRSSMLRLVDDAPSPATFRASPRWVGPCLSADLSGATRPGPGNGPRPDSSPGAGSPTLLGLPRARSEAGGLRPAGRADAPWLHHLLALSARYPPRDRHNAGGNALRAGQLRHPRLHRPAAVAGREAAVSRRRRLGADRAVWPSRFELPATVTLKPSE